MDQSRSLRFRLTFVRHNGVLRLLGDSQLLSTHGDCGIFQHKWYTATSCRLGILGGPAREQSPTSYRTASALHLGRFRFTPVLRHKADSTRLVRTSGIHLTPSDTVNEVNCISKLLPIPVQARLRLLSVRSNIHMLAIPDYFFSTGVHWTLLLANYSRREYFLHTFFPRRGTRAVSQSTTPHSDYYLRRLEHLERGTTPNRKLNVILVQVPLGRGLELGGYRGDHFTSITRPGHGRNDRHPRIPAQQGERTAGWILCYRVPLRQAYRQISGPVDGIHSFLHRRGLDISQIDGDWVLTAARGTDVRGTSRRHRPAQQLNAHGGLYGTRRTSHERVMRVPGRITPDQRKNRKRAWEDLKIGKKKACSHSGDRLFALLTAKKTQGRRVYIIADPVIRGSGGFSEGFEDNEGCFFVNEEVQIVAVPWQKQAWIFLIGASDVLLLRKNNPIRTERLERQ
ncbi:hypothetical protein C8F04DRAFT_1182623 [Mycena alexandri]|uniref:Uncharacterized protein n=1 Tax=Mycena alexandri TaxID=1745969 RepID=A0AAD6SY58_9AGAR|nr:hypothetical protein C8F04DRAFT_1182623 [Mycena alexandri]